MVDITPLIPEGRQVIERYGNGGFQVGGVVHHGSLYILPLQSSIWDVKSFDDINKSSFDPILNIGQAIELLVIGTGKQQHFLSPDLIDTFKSHNIRTEVMDTGAACRTYNVLLSEERFVAAALIAV